MLYEVITYPMKRLLAAGLGDCFQVCHVFRDGERGRLHRITSYNVCYTKLLRVGVSAEGSEQLLAKNQQL